MKKRFLSILLTLCLLFALVPVGAAADNTSFSDVQDSSKYYYDAVYWAANHDPQITGGYSDGTFRPNTPCNRAQVVTFLWRLAGKPEPSSTESKFTDVTNANTYYYKAVLWAVEQGITGGYKDGTFRPIQTVTRAQFVTFLWRYVGEPAPANSTSSFTDVQNSSIYYYSAVLWAAENAVTTGYSDGTFRPDNSCSRANVVTFLYRYVHEEAKPLSADTAVVGNYVTFGSYEQDNKASNGTEDIEWRVLAVENGKALLISKYALDCVAYDSTGESNKWSGSTLQNWMNDTFYDAAFTEEEQSQICKNTDTNDYVFALSLDEAETYFDYETFVWVQVEGSHRSLHSYPDLHCAPTAYAEAKGAERSGYNTCEWWLRGGGSGVVDIISMLGSNGIRTPDDTAVGVRPAIWVTIPASELSAETAVVGNYVTFGSYEQDNDLTNGKEDIEWRVLDVQDGKALLISKYVLDCQPYESSGVFKTWAECSLRGWLNSEFYNTAFNSEEKAELLGTTVQTPDVYIGYDANGNWIMNTSGEGITSLKKYISGGNTTEDHVFLLSFNEVPKYFSMTTGSTKILAATYATYPDIQASPTAYAVARGVNTALIAATSEGETGAAWWLRTGFYENQDSEGFVNALGIYRTGQTINADDVGVRPAIWVTLS